jgi:hypothetical protein
MIHCASSAWWDVVGLEKTRFWWIGDIGKKKAVSTQVGALSENAMCNKEIE